MANDWGPDPNPYRHPVARAAYYVALFTVFVLSMVSVVAATLFAGVFIS